MGRAGGLARGEGSGGYAEGAGDRRVTNPTNKWPAERNDLLRWLWTTPTADGSVLSTAEIGRQMHITKNAVVGQAHRLNLPGRPSPIRPPGVPNSPPPPREIGAGPTLAPLPGAAARAETVVMPETRHNYGGLEIPLNGRGSHARPAVVGATLASVREAPVVAAERYSWTKTCQWIEGQPRGAATEFCGAPVKPGTSYCGSHYARCYSRVRESYEARS